MTSPSVRRVDDGYQLSTTGGQQDTGARAVPLQEVATALERVTVQMLDTGIVANPRPSLTLDLPVVIQSPASRLIPKKPFYTVRDAALLTGMATPMVVDLIARGLIPTRRVGDDLRLLARSLDAYRPLARAMEAVARLNFDQDEVITYLRRVRRRSPWARVE